MDNKIRIALAAAILAVGMVLSAVVVSSFFIRIRHEKTISVKGYAEAPIRSDIGKFQCYYSTRAETLSLAHQELARIGDRVQSYLLENGLPVAAMTQGSVGSSKIHKRDAQGNSSNEIEYYELYQSTAVMSDDVELIQELAQKATSLMGEGLDVSISRPEYLVSDLDSLKVELLARATEDAYQRASTLSSHSGGAVGELVSARQGVFQITEPHSTETASYGLYDTSSIDKSIKAVVTLEYAVKA